MPRLEDATKKPSNIGEIIPPATPTAQQVPPIIPREQPGLGPASLGPAPSLWTTGYDSVRQWARPGTSQGRFPTLPTKANPQLNAATRSVTTTIIKNSPAPAFTGVTSVGLSMPSQFVVSGSPVTSSGTLVASWASAPTGTFLRAPLPGLTGLQALGLAQGNGNIGVSATPTASPSFALFFQAANASPQNIPSGFTAMPGTAGDLIAAYGTVTGTAPVGAATSEGSSVDWVSGLAIFNGPSPTFIQSRVSSAHVGTLAFSSNNTAGNTLIIIMQCLDFGATANYSLVASDSKNNNYVQLSSQRQPANGGAPVVQQTVLIATNCAGGPNTVSFNFSGTLVSAPIFSIVIVEFGPLSPGASIPVFGPLSPSDIPPVNLSTTGNGGIGGILPLLNGGTGVDLSNTGGTSQFLKQAFAGAPVTVVQPDFSDLAGVLGKLATKYNGQNLVSNGLPSELAKVDLTAQGAAIGATTLLSIPAAGMYRVSYSAKVTTAATTSSTLGGAAGFQLIYTDADDSVVITTPTWWGGGNNGAAPTSAALNTTQTQISGVLVVNAKAATNLQYLVGYTSSGATPMQYSIHVKVEAL